MQIFLLTGSHIEKLWSSVSMLSGSGCSNYTICRKMEQGWVVSQPLQV